MSFDAAHCTLCPRRCGADREKGVGLCHCGTEIRIARAALHPWEEPCISGRHGSGTVFFSGCALGCVFCQNRKISRQAVGKAVTVTQLAEIFLKLQEQQAHNINLVTGIHYTPWIVQALELAKPKLHIPVVWNCGGYESVETLRLLEDYDMTTEAAVAKLMWILGQTKDHDKVREMFYQTINHDILWNTGRR